LSLDTINEIDGNQEQSRNNTHQNLHAPTYHIEEESKDSSDMPLFEYNS
jgi:hypothetical protein